MTFEMLSGSGGWAAVLAVALFVGKQIYDSWLQKRRTDIELQADERDEIALGVGNATTVNAIMTKSIESLHSENARLIARTVFLEGVVAAKEAQIAERDIRIEELKARAVELSQQATELAQELTTYQRLISDQDKKTGTEEA